MGTAEARASRGPHTFSRVALGMALVVLFVGCTRDHEPPPEPAGPPGVQLLLTPREVRPGQLASISVRGGDLPVVGIDTSLDRWTGRDWRFEFILLKEWANYPASYSPVGTFVSIRSVGLEGHKTFAIKIPGEAQPGRYRIREDASFSGDPRPTPVVLSVQFEIVS